MTKIQIENNTTETIKESTFGIRSIQDLVHIFKVLRNKMYTDKVLAVIREYSTNAMDAHIESDQRTRPIFVHIPTVAEPYFSIRDYGTGLSEEGVRSIYTMYGASTKRGSTELNGQLGFGSKAAFSYANQYTITSYTGGKKYVYDAYIDESELGAVSLISETPSDEPTGVEIRVKIAATDVGVFKSKAETFYTYFNPTPLFNIGMSIKKPVYVIRRDKWAVKDSGSKQNYGFSTGPEIRLVMGNVSYPVDRNIILEFAGKSTDRKVIEAALQLPLDLFVPVGAANIAASREGLEYDKHTLATILNALRDCTMQVQEDYKKAIQDSPDIVQAKKLFIEAKSGVLHPIFKSLAESKAFIYKGVEITDEYFTIPNTTFTKTASDDRVLTYNACNLIKISENKGNKTGFSRAQHRSYRLLPSEIERLVVADADRPSLRAAAHSIAQKKDVLMIDLVPEQMTLAQFKSQIGFPESYLKSLTDIEPISIKREKSTVAKNKWRSFFKGRTSYNNTHWDTLTDDNMPTGDIYYIELNHKAPTVKQGETETYKDFSIDLYLNFINTAMAANRRIPVSNIIGVPKGQISKIDPTWKFLPTEINNRLAEFHALESTKTSLRKISMSKTARNLYSGKEYPFLTRCQKFCTPEVVAILNDINSYVSGNHLTPVEQAISAYIQNLEYNARSNYLHMLSNSNISLESLKKLDADYVRSIQNEFSRILRERPALEIVYLSGNNARCLQLVEQYLKI